MISKRSRNIMLEIFKKGSIHTADFSKMYKVSERTIRSDFIEIEYFLNRNDFEPLLHDGKKGISFSDVNLKTSLIYKLINQKEVVTASYTKEERRIELLYHLSMHCEAVKIDDLATLLLVSKSTIVKDLEYLKEYLTNESVHLQGYLDGIRLVGDEYDYSPSFHDFSITSRNCLTKHRIVVSTPLYASIEYTFVMQVPCTTSLEERSEEVTSIRIKTTSSIHRDEAQIYFKTEIDNTAKNHRIQVRFDSGKQLTSNIANIQLGEIIRQNDFTQTHESEHGWHERYYPVFNQHAYSGLKDADDKGFIILNKGLPQYEIHQEDTTHLAITLLSCVGNMGNPNLKYRPGRRSGSNDATPASQMLKTFTCEYAFMPIHVECDYIQTALPYVNPIYAVSYPAYTNDGDLSDSLDLITSNSGLYVTAFKKAEDQSGAIVRILNPYPTSLKDQMVQIDRHLFASISSVNLVEEPMKNEHVKVQKLNNPDSSAMVLMSGKVCIDTFDQIALVSLRLK